MPAGVSEADKSRLLDISLFPSENGSDQVQSLCRLLVRGIGCEYHRHLVIPSRMTADKAAGLAKSFNDQRGIPPGIANKAFADLAKRNRVNPFGRTEKCYREEVV